MDRIARSGLEIHAGRSAAGERLLLTQMRPAEAAALVQGVISHGRCGVILAGPCIFHYIMR